MTTERANFRAINPAPAGETQLDNERRFRASVEEAFDILDNAVRKAAKSGGTGTGGDCCGNIDGGHAGSIYGGIFCPVDGGNASGSADPTP